MSDIDKADCLFAKHTNRNGYGRVKMNGKFVLTHRLSYCQYNGLPLSAIHGVLIRHKCDNRACFNPLHLEPGTAVQNSQDMVDRGRSHKWHDRRKGEGNPRSKITWADVAAIRAKYKFNCRVGGTADIAREYNLSHRAVIDIVRMRKWIS